MGRTQLVEDASEMDMILVEETTLDARSSISQLRALITQWRKEREQLEQKTGKSVSSLLAYDWMLQRSENVLDQLTTMKRTLGSNEYAEEEVNWLRELLETAERRAAEKKDTASGYTPAYLQAFETLRAQLIFELSEFC